MDAISKRTLLTFAHLGEEGWGGGGVEGTKRLRSLSPAFEKRSRLVIFKFTFLF